MRSSFLSYYLLTERHANVSQAVNNNVKLILKELANEFRTKYKKILDKICKGLSTEYDWILAGFYMFKQFMLQDEKDAELLFEKEIQMKVKNYTKKMKIGILLVDESEGIHGAFIPEDNEINVQLDFNEVPESEDRVVQNSIIRKLQVYLAHELMHAYQYISQHNFVKPRPRTDASEAIPHSFSYIVYFLSSEEIEANLMSAFSQFKKHRKEGITYCNQLLRLIDFNISTVDNGEDKNHFTPQILQKKYKDADDLNDLFCLDYILGVYLPKSRFYTWVKNDRNYQLYVRKLDVDNLEARMNVIDEIYNFLEEKFHDNKYDHLGQAFHLVANFDSLNKMYSSTEFARSIQKKIENNDFTDEDAVYDEEEDTVVYGRPDLD